MQLYNKLSAKQRAQLIDEAGEKRITVSFYQYAHIKNPKVFRDELYIRWDALGVLGRTYIAEEGVNGQLSVGAQNFEASRGNTSHCMAPELSMGDEGGEVKDVQASCLLADQCS